MPNWLTTATGGKSGKSDDAPQAFRLICECTEEHSGQRKARPQRIICRTCGTALFVLPKNVYPPPRERKPPGKKRKKKKNSPLPTASVLPSTNELAGAVRSSVAGAAGGVGRGVQSAANGLQRWIVGGIRSMVSSIRAAITPFRLVLAGIGVMLLATAFVAVRSQMQESARLALREEFEAGQQALQSEDVVAAREHFEAAAAAAATLGVNDAQSVLVEQLHRETLAMTRLAPGSLFQVVEDAEDSQQQFRSIRWEDIFESRYAGKWMVLQAPIRRQSGGYVVDLPVTVGRDDRELVVQADLPLFDELSFEEEATEAVFAAPLQSCELNESKDRWTLTLGGEEGFLWTNLDNLRLLGMVDPEWTDEDALRQLLEDQKVAAGEAE